MDSTISATVPASPPTSPALDPSLHPPVSPTSDVFQSQIQRAVHPPLNTSSSHPLLSFFICYNNATPFHLYFTHIYALELSICQELNICNWWMGQSICCFNWAAQGHSFYQAKTAETFANTSCWLLCLPGITELMFVCKPWSAQQTEEEC